MTSRFWPLIGTFVSPADDHIVGDGEASTHLTVTGTVPDKPLEGQSRVKPCSVDGGLAVASIAEGQECEVLKGKIGGEVVRCVHWGHDSVPRGSRAEPGEGANSQRAGAHP